MYLEGKKGLSEVIVVIVFKFWNNGYSLYGSTETYREVFTPETAIYGDIHTFTSKLKDDMGLKC